MKPFLLNRTVDLSPDLGKYDFTPKDLDYDGLTARIVALTERIEREAPVVEERLAKAKVNL